MKKEKIKYSIACAISLVLFVLVAVFAGANRINENTDIIMPSIYIFDGITIWYVMLLGLVAETAIVKCFLKETLLKSLTISMVMNVVTAILGIVGLHIISLIVELLFIFFSYGSFHVSHWIVNFILIIFANACIEGLTLKIGFKYKFKKTFWWLCLANAISIIICILFNLYWIGEMFF